MAQKMKPIHSAVQKRKNIDSSDAINQNKNHINV